MNLRFFMTLVVILCWSDSEKLAGADEPALRPNIVLIYADDLGYGDVACYNPERGKIATPHLDQLARQGMRFTDAHSSSGVCSPSRYALLTGRYHWRTRLQSGIVGLWERPLIPPNRMTVASILKSTDYQTACIGKWHLGWEWPLPKPSSDLFRPVKTATINDDYRNAWRTAFSQPIQGGPTTLGFDHYFGTDVPNWPPYCFIEDNRTVGIPSEMLPQELFLNHLASLQGPAMKGWKLETILPTLGEKANDFIIQSSKKDRPFFLFLSLTAPHTPLAVNEEWQGKSGLIPYADLVMETDAIVGSVLKTIEDTGKANNTLVIFTSDNGCAPYIGAEFMEEKGHFPSGPLRGYKSDIWEGGHRVPLIIRWPGEIKNGSVCNQLVHQSDFMATFAKIVGVTLPENAGEDSINLLPLFSNPKQQVRETSVNQSIRGLLAIRHHNWKLIFGPGSGGWSQSTEHHRGQLYDLNDDLNESNNRFSSEPEIVAQLTAMMQSFVEDGRSTPGAVQQNDVPVDWQRFLAPIK